MNPFKITPESAAHAQRLARLHDEARARAKALRAEAVDDFWRGVGEVLCSTWAYLLATARRNAQRLGRALARRQARRPA